MTFRRELAAKVIAGEKTVTRRKVSDNPRSPWWREKCGYRVGQEVAICPGRGKYAIGRARIVAVERVRLGVVPPAEARAEGFDGSIAFGLAWSEINGRYDRDAIVWRVEIEVIR